MQLNQKLVSSSLLLVVARLFERVSGLISLLILARLLTPEDFGVIGITALIIYFFDMLSNIGSEQYIIQKEKVNEQDLDTAWSLDCLLKSSLWLLLLICSPIISTFFNLPELQYTIYALSFIILMNAINNPQLFLLKKQLNYTGIFKLLIIKKITALVVVITIAYLYKSFWAIIIADLVASLIYLIGSYLIKPYRPTWTIKHYHAQFAISKWLLLKGIVGYTRSQIDNLIVSKFFSTTHFGNYYMARDIAMLPNSNILQPALEPLLAIFSENKENSIANKIENSLIMASCFILPVCFYVFNFSNILIKTLLGEQWGYATEILSSMVLIIFYYGYLLICEHVLIATKKVKLLFYNDLFSLICIISIISTYLLLTTSNQVTDIAWIRGAIGIFFTLGMLIYLYYLFSFNVLKVLSILILISLISISSIYIASNILSKAQQHNWLDLPLSLSAFLCAYVLHAFVLYLTYYIYKRTIR
ncbi:oligosaccharide flippase family protein [Thalassotalea agariperforans]